MSHPAADGAAAMWNSTGEPGPSAGSPGTDNAEPPAPDVEDGGPRRLWLRPPRAFHLRDTPALVGALFHPALGWMGVVGVLVGLFMPPVGVGFSSCSFLAKHRLPCPSCGLTRSVSCVLQGRWDWAWTYHPLGFLVAGFFVTLAVLLVTPAAVRARWRAALEAYDRTIAFALIGVFVGLFAYGMIRMGAVAWGDPMQTWWRWSDHPPSIPAGTASLPMQLIGPLFAEGAGS